MKQAILVCLASVCYLCLLHFVIPSILYLDPELEAVISHMSTFLFKRNYQHKNSTNSNPLNISSHESYCAQNDLYKMMHPAQTLLDHYIYVEGGLPFQESAAKNYERVTQPKLKNRKGRKFIIPNETGLIFTKYDHLNKYFHVGKNIYAAGHCLFQKYNHIPGGENFNNLKLHALLKDAILKWSISGKQQCIKDASIYPETYRVSINEECRFFKDRMKIKPFVLKDYKWRNHTLFEEREEFTCEQAYPTTLVVQEYFGSRLADFRAYVLIASTHPIIVYLHEDILFRECDLSRCRTRDLTFDRFLQQLFRSGKIKNLDWKYDYFFPRLDSLVFELVQLTQNHLAQDSKFFQMLYLDVVLNHDGSMFVVDVARDDFSEKNSEFHQRMYEEMLDLMVAYSRSKFQRLKAVINKVYLKMNRLGQTIKEAATVKHFRELKEGYKDKVDVSVELGINFRRIYDSSNPDTAQKERIFNCF